MASVSSHQWKNVVVGLGRSNNPKLAGFFSCVLDHFSVKGNSAHVNCELANNVLNISVASDSHAGHHNLSQGETLATEGVTVDGISIGPVILEVNHYGTSLMAFFLTVAVEVLNVMSPSPFSGSVVYVASNFLFETK